MAEGQSSGWSLKEVGNLLIKKLPTSRKEEVVEVDGILEKEVLEKLTSERRTKLREAGAVIPPTEGIVGQELVNFVFEELVERSAVRYDMPAKNTFGAEVVRWTMKTLEAIKSAARGGAEEKIGITDSNRFWQKILIDEASDPRKRRDGLVGFGGVHVQNREIGKRLEVNAATLGEAVSDAMYCVYSQYCQNQDRIAEFMVGVDRERWLLKDKDDGSKSNFERWQQAVKDASQKELAQRELENKGRFGEKQVTKIPVGVPSDMGVFFNDNGDMLHRGDPYKYAMMRVLLPDGKVVDLSLQEDLVGRGFVGTGSDGKFRAHFHTIFAGRESVEGVAFSLGIKVPGRDVLCDLISAVEKQSQGEKSQQELEKLVDGASTNGWSDKLGLDKSKLQNPLYKGGVLRMLRDGMAYIKLMEEFGIEISDKTFTDLRGKNVRDFGNSILAMGKKASEEMARVGIRILDKERFDKVIKSDFRTNLGRLLAGGETAKEAAANLGVVIREKIEADVLLREPILVSVGFAPMGNVAENSGGYRRMSGCEKLAEGGKGLATVILNEKHDSRSGKYIYDSFDLFMSHTPADGLMAQRIGGLIKDSIEIRAKDPKPRESLASVFESDFYRGYEVRALVKEYGLKSAYEGDEEWYKNFFGAHEIVARLRLDSASVGFLERAAKATSKLLKDKFHEAEVSNLLKDSSEGKLSDIKAKKLAEKFAPKASNIWGLTMAAGVELGSTPVVCVASGEETGRVMVATAGSVGEKEVAGLKKILLSLVDNKKYTDFESLFRECIGKLNIEDRIDANRLLQVISDSNKFLASDISWSREGRGIVPEIFALGGGGLLETLLAPAGQLLAGDIKRIAADSTGQISVLPSLEQDNSFFDTANSSRYQASVGMIGKDAISWRQVTNTGDFLDAMLRLDGDWYGEDYFGRAGGLLKWAAGANKGMPKGLSEIFEEVDEKKREQAVAKLREELRVNRTLREKTAKFFASRIDKFSKDDKIKLKEAVTDIMVEKVKQKVVNVAMMDVFMATFILKMTKDNLSSADINNLNLIASRWSRVNLDSS